jgi:hypothetical protein
MEPISLSLSFSQQQQQLKLNIESDERIVGIELMMDDICDIVPHINKHDSFSFFSFFNNVEPLTQKKKEKTSTNNNKSGFAMF